MVNCNTIDKDFVIMMKVSLSILGLFGIMVFGGSVVASNALPDDYIIEEDSVFIKGSFFQRSGDPKNDSEDLDPDIDIGMRFHDLVAAFKKAGSIGASFFEASIYGEGVSDEDLEELSAVAPYIQRLCLNTSGLDNSSLVFLQKFTELRWLDLTFNSLATPPVEFFQHFPHLKEVSLDTNWDTRKEAVRKLQESLPHIKFS